MSFIAKSKKVLFEAQTGRAILDILADNFDGSETQDLLWFGL